MDVNMNDIDDILQNLNVGTPPENSENSFQDSNPSEETNMPLSDEELNEIIEDNGLSEEEESYDENQGEGNDIDLEESEEEESVATTENNTPDNTKIPLNSPTLLIDESTTRFSGAEWFNEIQKARIIIAGIGGIGSNVAFQLARMIPANLTLYDDDNVEMVNMAGQLFCSNDIGEAKVNAIANMIHNYASMKQVLAIKDKFTSDKERYYDLWL